MRRRRRFFALAEGALILVFLVLAAIIANRLLAARRIREEERAAAEAHRSLVVSVTAVPEKSDAEPPEIQAEIRELMRQNEDAVGLLHFDGDRTLYVCQTTDNSYYMTHRFDRSEDPAGMIYMDYRDSLWPRSANLILYGHNMRDGSRFGTLKRFEKTEHIEEYPIFQLAERYETVDYVPFAVFHTSVDAADESFYPYDQIDFADENGFNRYVRDVKERSILDLPVEVAYGDRLLTLVTCHSGIDRGRLVIVCREVKPEDGLS
ncbi:MAG: class B sortase [Clostridia bacterium]|nr:class B sortase [Clostridia bacterium]